MIGLLVALGFSASAATAPAAAPATPPVAVERCMAMIAEGDNVRLVETPQFTLLRGPQALVLPNVGATISGVECIRTDIVPAVGDIRLLLQHGLPLFIVEGQRVLLLSIPEGQVQAQMMRGALTDDERTRVLARLAEYERLAPPSAR